jgi:hypothetical protein
MYGQYDKDRPAYADKVKLDGVRQTGGSGHSSDYRHRHDKLRSAKGLWVQPPFQTPGYEMARNGRTAAPVSNAAPKGIGRAREDKAGFQPYRKTLRAE